MSISECPFCDRIVRGKCNETEVRSVVSFIPLNPATPGHRLFVPIVHDEHPSPIRTAFAMHAAAAWAQDQGGDYNLITSAGPGATQTVQHIHVHYVPRHAGDGLALPWTGQEDRHVDQ